MRNAATTGLLAIAGAMLLQVATPAAALTVLYEKSRISCVSRQEKVPVEAQFRKFTAQIAFSPARPETGKAKFDIDLGSFDVGFDEYNDEVKSKNWFDTRNFPHATFVSTGIRALGGGKFEVRGPLTIKGKTNIVVASFTYKEEGGIGIFDGAFPIRRLEYNIGDGVWRDTATVADEVQIKFRIAVSAAHPAVKK